MHGVILVIGVAATMAVVIGVATTGVVVIIMEIMRITNMDKEDPQEQILTETTEALTQIIRFLRQAGIKVQFQGKIIIPVEILHPIQEDVKQLKLQGLEQNLPMLTQMF